MKVDKTKWEKCKLEDLCTNESSNIVISKVEIGRGNYSLFGASGLIGNINFYQQERPYLGIVKDGSGVGRVAKYPSFTSLVGTMQYILPKENVDIDYLHYLLVSLHLDKYVKGAAIPHIYFRHYKLEKTYLPPLSDQQTIATELDSIQTIIDGYKAQLADLDALAQSIFLDMFGDPITNPKGWEKKELRELGIISSGGTPLRSNPLYYKGDIDWYSAGELNHLYLNGSNEKITKEAIKESSAKLFKANSLFIGLYDTAAFKLGITLKEASANQACANLFPIKDNVIWIYYCLLNMKEYAWNFRKGIRQKNLSVGFIKSFSVPLPPLSLQQQFANQVEAIEKQKDLLREQLKDAETLMAERMQYYFS